MREVVEEQCLRRVSPTELTVLQLRLLRLAALNGGLRVGEVACVLGLSPPAATKNIDKLERLGLMVRSPSKEDRRATLLALSRKGHRLVEKYESLRCNRLAPVLEEFSDEEVSLLSRLVERFSLKLASQGDLNAGTCLWCAGYCESGCSIAEMRGGCPYQKFRAGREGDGEGRETR